MERAWSVLAFTCTFLQTLVGTFFVCFFYFSDFSYLFSIHRVSWAVCFQLQSYQRFHTTAWTNHQGQCTRTLIFSLPLFLFASRVARHVPAVSWQHICSYAVDDWYAAIPIQHGSSMPGYRSSLAWIWQCMDSWAYTILWRWPASKCVPMSQDKARYASPLFELGFVLVSSSTYNA